jgi:hypothetical protein
MPTKDLPAIDAMAVFERTGTPFSLQGRASQLQPQAMNIRAFDPDTGRLTIYGAGSSKPRKTRVVHRALPLNRAPKGQVFRTAKPGSSVHVLVKGKALPKAASGRLERIASSMQSPVELLDQQVLDTLAGLLKSDVGEVTLSYERDAGRADDSVQSEDAPTSLKAWVQGVAPNAEAALEANAQRLAERRRQIIEACRTIPAETLAKSSGSLADLPRAYLQRLRADGKVLAFKAGSAFRYPAFQLDATGSIARVVQALLEHGREIGWPPHGDMQMMLWLHSPESELQGARPLDLLTSNPERVVHAFIERFQRAGSQREVGGAEGV